MTPVFKRYVKTFYIDAAGQSAGSNRETGNGCTGNVLQRGGGDGKDMPGCSGSGPNQVEVQKSWVHPQRAGLEMPKRGHAADGKAGFGPDECGIRPFQRLLRQGTCPSGVDAVSPGRQKQCHMPACSTPEQDRLHDLVQRATCRRCGLLCCARLVRHFAQVKRDARCVQRRADPCQAFAHVIPQVPVGTVPANRPAPQAVLCDRLTLRVPGATVGA